MYETLEKRHVQYLAEEGNDHGLSDDADDVAHVVDDGLTMLPRHREVFQSVESCIASQGWGIPDLVGNEQWGVISDALLWDFV